MKLMTLLLPVMLGVETVAPNSASIVLSGGTSDGEPGGIPPGSFDLGFYEDAFVAQGSYSGIRVTFKTQDQGADHHALTLFIPSHGDFSVGYASSRGEHTSRIPEAPFTFRAEQSAGVKDRFGRPRPMKVEFAHWRQVAEQSWLHSYVEFTDCEIQVESMFIEAHKLTFSGGFVCRSKQPALSATGRFAVNAGKLGVSKVD